MCRLLLVREERRESKSAPASARRWSAPCTSLCISTTVCVGPGQYLDVGKNMKPHSASAGGARISGMKTFRKKYASPPPRNWPCRTSVDLQHNNYSDHCLPLPCSLSLSLSLPLLRLSCRLLRPTEIEGLDSRAGCSEWLGFNPWTCSRQHPSLPNTLP